MKTLIFCMAALSVVVLTAALAVAITYADAPAYGLSELWLNRVPGP